LNDDGPAKNVRGRRGQAEQKTEQDGMHREWKIIAEGHLKKIRQNLYLDTKCDQPGFNVNGRSVARFTVEIRP
jgi:hypothetical protein